MRRIVFLVASFFTVGYGARQEKVLISELNSFFGFNNNIYVVEPHVHIDSLMNASDAVTRTLLVPKSKEYNFKAFEATVRESNDRFLILAPRISDFDGNTSFLNLAMKMDIFKDTKIGIFFSEFVSIADVNYVRQWCWSKDIVNVIVTTRVSENSSINVYSFYPNRLVNVTDLSYEQFFLNLNSNQVEQMHYKISPIRYYADGVLWPVVFSLLNASYEEIELNQTRLIQEAKRLGVDVITDLYSQEDLSHLRVYCTGMVAHILVVPEALPYSGFLAYVLAAVSSEEFCIYTSLALAGVITILIIVRYFSKKHFLIIQSAADVLNLLMNDNGYIKYQKLSRSEACLIVPLTFVGLVIVNGIFSNLQSYLTQPVYQPQMSTADDIYKSQLPIIVFEQFWKTLAITKLENETVYKNWGDRIIVREGLAMDVVNAGGDRLLPFLTSMGYLAMISATQKRLNVRGYRKTDIEILTALYSYRVTRRFIYVDRLNDILLRLKSSGLHLQWVRQERKISEKTLEKKLMQNLAFLNKSEINLKVEFPIFIVYGWAVGVIVFASEIAWKNVKKRTSSI